MNQADEHQPEADDLQTLADAMRDGPAEVVASVRPRPTTPNHPIRWAVILVLLAVGGLLLAWAAYGALILKGIRSDERENAESMAKLMLFAGGPVGAALMTSGSVMLARLMRR